MGKEEQAWGGREQIPVRVSGVTGRMGGCQSLLRREHCSKTGEKAKLERTRLGQHVKVKLLREMRLSELSLQYG